MHRKLWILSAAITSRATIGRGRPAPSSRISVGVFGWGTIAATWTPSFLNNEKCQVVAVADPMREGTNYGYKGELRAAGVARVYTPKDFELDAIMGDLVGLVGERASALHA